MVHKNKKLLAGLGVLAVTATLFSFSNEKGKKKYEIIHHSEGKTTTYDTIIPSNSNYTVDAFLADKGISSEHIEIIQVPNGKSKMMFIEKDGEHSTHNMEFKEENVEINIEVDDAGNKTIVKKVNGEVVELTAEELDEIEKNMGEGQVHIFEFEEGDSFEFTDDLPEGAERVEIRAEIDDNGNLVAHKFVNGEEVELTEEELDKLQSHENSEVNEENNDEHQIVISQTISIEETDDGKEKNKTENHDIQWSSNDMNQEFTIVLVTEDIDETSTDSRKVTAKNNADFSIYPNPNNGHFTLLLEQTEKLKTNISIVDAQGKIVFEENLGEFSGKFSKQIDLKQFGNGTYIISVEQGNNKTAQKIMVQK